MKKILRFVPVTIFVLLVVGFSAAAIIDNSDPKVQTVVVTPALFRPVSTDGLTLLTKGPLVPGQKVTLQNGVCNTADESYSFLYTFGVRQAGDPLSARYVELSGTSLQPLDANGCWRQEPFEVTLPSIVTPGVWQYYATLTVMGNQAGQAQRVPLTTEPFVVSEP